METLARTQHFPVESPQGSLVSFFGLSKKNISVSQGRISLPGFGHRGCGKPGEIGDLRNVTDSNDLC